MTLRVCLCVTLLLSLSTVCLSYGSLQLGPRSSIVGGEDAPPGRWPWMVYLSISDGKKKNSCGGSLVSSQWILTAAHCLNQHDMGSPDLSLSYARLGELKLHHTPRVRHTFKRFLLHPAYRVTRGVPNNDIALLELTEPLPTSDTVKPVALPGPRDVFTPGSECWVTGWGNVGQNKPLGGDQTLQQLKLPLVDDDACRERYPHISKNQLCAGDMLGGKDACQGDSGGPLVCKSFDMFVQVGVVSYGVGCGRHNYPGVYTRVYNYMQFIEDSIGKYR